MEGFFVHKVIQVKGVRYIKRAAFVWCIIHLCPKLRNQLDNLKYVCQLHHVTYVLPIKPHMSMEKKHIDVQGWLEDINNHQQCCGTRKKTLKKSP